ncbi:MAG: HAD family hydrolase, partial [Clostridia bacterium]|nr:HAD family hydrolase [Clostridia bacterium]
MALLYPTLYRNRITDITVQDLEKLGVRGLLLDVDNTLTTHGSQHLSDEVSHWLAGMRRAGIAMTVVSNSWEWRVAPFAQRIGLRHISLSCKPLPFGFLRGVRRLGLKRSQCAAIGDQVFT